MAARSDVSWARSPRCCVDLDRKAFATPLELRQSLAATAFGEDRLLRRPLGDANALASACKFHLRFVLASAGPRRAT